MLTKKINILIITLIVLSFGYEPIRYKDKIFTEVEKSADVKYGSNKDYQNNQKDLHIDIYQPKNDTVKSRPCLVFVHGGSFMTGNKEEPNLVHLCNEFAKRGYVTSSIQYRLGTGWSYQGFSEAILRAVQDAKAAVRFLRKNKTTYGIDESKFVVGGTSAGGVTALHYAYMDSKEIPSVVDTNALGGIEGSSGTPGVSSAIACIINCWGALGDTAFMMDGETIPVVSFHGTEDNVVPYDVGFAFGMPFLPLHGSAAIERVCKRQNITSYLQSYVGLGHGFSGPDSPYMDTTLSVMVDFLFDNLIGNSPISRTPFVMNKAQERGALKLMYTQRQLPHTLMKDQQFTLYSVNGKRISSLRNVNKAHASGLIILYKRNN